MFALVDCNNFFVSAERVFRPNLRNKPVCVLSNNDGCVVSLSNEAKALGIKRGDPLFRIRELTQRHDVAIFSSNYTLYAGMSSRVMSILAAAVSEIEIYSIDEAFLHLDGLTPQQAHTQMLALSKQVARWTGIPISIGIASTKTLAKVAARYAKKYAGYHGVCLIDNETKRTKALKGLAVGDVWGVGRRTVKKFETMGIVTAYDLANLTEAKIRQQFTVTMLHTWQELNGVACIEGNESPDKQSICVSRSFGSAVKTLDELKETVAAFTASATQKLRKQHSLANMLTVFIATGRFNRDEERYAGCESCHLPIATADSVELIHYAERLLSHIYQQGFLYKKSGVILSGIVDDTSVQQDIFDEIGDRQKRSKLYQVIDQINLRDGNNTVQYAIQHSAQSRWKSKTDFVSPNYLSDINGLLEVH